jgi:hypothetical protein
MLVTDLPARNPVDVTATGTKEFSTEELPNCPALFKPQQKTAPDASAHAKFCPTETEETIFPFKTPELLMATGIEESIEDPFT